MKKIFFLLLCLILLISCGGGGGSSSGGGGSGSGYIGGNYSGQWISTKDGNVKGDLDVNIQQSGTQISGTVSATNTARGDINGNILGTISKIDEPGQISARVAWTNGGSGTYWGFYNNTMINGFYNDSGGDYGSFKVTRK